MRSVGGVPPDYFSADASVGQPNLSLDRIAQNNFRWWVDRFRFAFEHLTCFVWITSAVSKRFWSVPLQMKLRATVIGCQSGAALFEAVKPQLGDAPIIAENLGVISRK